MGSGCFNLNSNGYKSWYLNECPSQCSNAGSNDTKNSTAPLIMFLRWYAVGSSHPSYEKWCCECYSKRCLRQGCWCISSVFNFFGSLIARQCLCWKDTGSSIIGKPMLRMQLFDFRVHDFWLFAGWGDQSKAEGAIRTTNNEQKSHPAFESN